MAERTDALHKATSSIARTKQLSVVVLENLNVAGMVKNRKLSKAISDVSLSEFRRQVEYKAERKGLKVVLADRFFPLICEHGILSKTSLVEREVGVERMSDSKSLAMMGKPR